MTIYKLQRVLLYLRKRSVKPCETQSYSASHQDWHYMQRF